MALVADLTARRLTAVLASEQRRGRVPSVAAALTREGSLVWRGGYGSATGSEVRPTDLQYRIGSITKTLTAVLVMQLRDEGRLSLSDPLSAHLPEVAHGDRTLRALLCHGSGIPAEPPGPWWERTDGGSFADLAASLSRDPTPFEPGATHHYSNVGFALLGEVVARLHGRSWWECVSERVLQPLGMTRTTFDPFAPHAQGYSVAPYTPELAREPHSDTGAMAPAGQLWSTVMDLATFADFLLTGHRDVLSPATLEEMATPQSGTHVDGVGDGYGLGVRMVAGGSGTLVGHTGSMPGFQAGLFVDPGRGTGAVLLANCTTGLSTADVARRLLETLEECEPSLVAPWEPVDEVPPAVAELVGVWHWGNTPRLMTWDGAALLVSELDGGEPERFRLVDGRLVGADGYHHGEELEVVRRADGSVSHLVASTFVMTRVPYDPDAPVPGGPPR
ncbi:serine hydrolase domain-containing protein [Nocardioides caldifontis]|uniref:serine hydrolase domain-containing protein n=1 Tax=Nocardioides caldifontis TaxID=2588938 RepID=UPI0011DF1ED9|nr:serine hydrolase domain-containing protein [Nocardioides caldifontis]